jgi:hypothetical protein
MLALVLAFFLSSPANALMIVSDVDDTIKVSNSGNKIDWAWRGMFKKTIYAGMPELLASWRDTGATLHLVTASPGPMAPRMRSMLRHHSIQFETLKWRGDIFQDMLEFKVEAISGLLDQAPEEDVILIGDDVGKDPEVFVEISRKYGLRVLATYVRPVKNRPLFLGQRPYLTAYEIFSHEHLEGRLPIERGGDIAQSILAAPPKHVVPRFAWCPAELTLAPNSEAQQVEGFVEQICRGRQSETKTSAQ